MWIFGYGSLVWKADFPYVKKIIGYIKGYERKFWQASIDHRGVPGKPGRVVTLIPSPDPEAKVWGAVYKIHARDVDHVVQHLDLREVMGYEKTPVDFYPVPNHPLNLYDVDVSSSTSLFSGEPQSQTSVPSSKPKSNGHEQVVHATSTTKSNGLKGAKTNGFSSTFISTLNGDDKDVQGKTNNKSNGLSQSKSHQQVNGYSTWTHPNQTNSSTSNHTTNGSPNNINANSVIPNTNTTITNGPSRSPSFEFESQSEDEVNEVLEGKIDGGHFRVTMYYGNSENAHFVGPAPVEEMVNQILESSGPSGTNREYLYNLADAMRQISDEANDSHLAELETKVRKLEMSNTKRRSGRSTPIEL